MEKAEKVFSDWSAVKVNHTEVVPGKLVACQWCGKVRSKKVKGTGRDGRRITVCQEHFLRPDGSLVNKPTAAAIARVRESAV